MIKDYMNQINDAMYTIDDLVLSRVRNSLLLCAERGFQVLTIGNGGSAAIADHWSCDHTKGVRGDTRLFPNVRSLAQNVSMVTAIANDISYDEIFSQQINYCQEDYALVLAVSSSGNSPNIVKGLQAARDRGYGTIAFVGFDGGKVVKDNMADYILHVKSNNYGVVEDCHQILMHIVAQNLRTTYTYKDPYTLKL